MKFVSRAVLLTVVLTGALWAVSGWQVARIVGVNETTETRSQVWVVNTPITEEQKVYILTVHVRDKMITASYAPKESEPPPPEDWKKDKAVQAQIAGDYLYVRSSAAGEVRARISKTKPAPPVKPWTQEEIAVLRTALTPDQDQDSDAIIGFDSTSKSAKSKKAAEPATPEPEVVVPPPPPPAEPTTGLVHVSSVPYLAEVFVDGTSVGYTPAKVALNPGKHTFRCEKQGYQAWTKEILITAGSELTLDATLPLAKK
jgi:hypothetical protein